MTTTRAGEPGRVRDAVRWHVASFFEIDSALARHGQWLDAFVPHTFLGDHDVRQIASRLTDARPLPHARVVLSVGEGPAEVPARGAGRLRDGDAEVQGTGTDGARLRLPAHGWAVLEA